MCRSRMATSNSAEQPAWQRSSIFEFFASLKLAVVLLAVLIVAAIAGTIYESSFDSKVARTYVYGAPWFNLWLVLLYLYSVNAKREVTVESSE